MGEGGSEWRECDGGRKEEREGRGGQKSWRKLGERKSDSETVGRNCRGRKSECGMERFLGS